MGTCLTGFTRRRHIGYTSYFQQQREITDKEWTAICKDARKIIKTAIASGIPLAWDYDELGKKPEVSKELIRFNGIAANGHETFYLPRVMESGYRGDKYRFNFCKTARKPYDQVVGAILLSMHEHAPGAWDIASDGGVEDEEWAYALELYHLAVGADRRPVNAPWLQAEA